eukprot:CAMPEP_0115221028 /NCGR_PEP_ID=MMETSP0270-20121206/27753_1 /TAXON_ID=71861 /ORGANISM="Scrippsiella trochoidea, Strain CCMP3099" /LENGTH=51 /DNA_ID=CAMNT_0002635105 /DNA_START=582 /DNA_END=737 /DNA_ORIENTATION=-
MAGSSSLGKAASKLGGSVGFCRIEQVSATTTSCPQHLPHDDVDIIATNNFK